MGPDTAQDVIKARGLEIFRLIGAETPTLFDRGWWAGRMMERVMRDPSLKVPLFRFVDVLPALKDSRQITRHAREYFADGTSPLPWFVNFLPTAYKVAAEIPVPGEGFYVSPTVITDLPPNSKILKEEIFGPVLAVIRVGDIEEAVGLANSSDYALTGGLFSRSPATIRRVGETFEVGNLYINRGITGAVVGRQPFGGFRMSGVGSKAGGPDYLLQFMEPRVITENTMRRGFSPDLLP